MNISREVKVGFFAVISITIFYVGFNYLKGIDFLSRTNQYYVVYKDVGGLVRSNAVKISGTNVGRVSNITLLQKHDNQVLVELDIDKNIVLGTDAVAKLDAELLGSVSILLSVGDISTPLISGDTLNARVDPSLTQIAQPFADELEITITRINALLKDLSDSSDHSLKSAVEEANKTMSSLRSLMDINKYAIKATLLEFKALGANLNEKVDLLKPTLTSLGHFADSLNDLELNKTIDGMNLLVGKLNDTISKMSSEEGTLGKLMSNDSVYNNLNTLLLDLDSLTNHFNEYPNHFMGPLGKSKKKIEKELAKENK